MLFEKVFTRVTSLSRKKQKDKCKRTGAEAELRKVHNPENRR